MSLHLLLLCEQATTQTEDDLSHVCSLSDILVLNDLFACAASHEK